MGAVVPIEVAPTFVRPTDLPHTCSDEHLIFAVQEWIIGASDDEVCKHLHVRKQELKDWVRSRGWQTVAEMVREDVRRVAHSHLTRQFNSISAQIMERLNKGDPIVNENGKITGYRPIRARELSSMQRQVIESIEIIENRLGLSPDNSGRLSLTELNTALQRYAHENIFPKMKPRTINGIAIDVGESESAAGAGVAAADGEPVGEGAGGGAADGPLHPAGRREEQEHQGDIPVFGQPGVAVEDQQCGVAAE